METWIPKGRLSAVMHQNLLISRDGEDYAKGRLESCLYHLSERRLARTKEIAFPTDVAQDREFALPGFQKLAMIGEDMEYAYAHQVRYMDLDKTGHMTNLKYIDLFLNAFSSSFFKKFQIHEFELHYLDQCFEGEQLQVYKRETKGKVLLTALHSENTPCAVAYMA